MVLFGIPAPVPFFGWVEEGLPTFLLGAPPAAPRVLRALRLTYLLFLAPLVPFSSSRVTAEVCQEHVSSDRATSITCRVRLKEF